MPRGSPFTKLCQRAATLARPPAADLHVHTTASDGDFTPSQVVARARANRLEAIAITDHDTLAGVTETLNDPRSDRLEVIAGVEWSVEHGGREYHILGLFLNPLDPPVLAALANVCERRRERFFQILKQLESGGLKIPPGLAEATAEGAVSLGRRHVAGLLVRAGLAPSRSEAFRRYILPVDHSSLTNHRTPSADALRLINGAGGISSLAHPPLEIESETLVELRERGLDAVEISYPSATPGHTARLRELARVNGLATTAGSDYHGPDPAGRTVGSHGVSREELEQLRGLAGRSV